MCFATKPCNPSDFVVKYVFSKTHLGLFQHVFDCSDCHCCLRLPRHVHQFVHCSIAVCSGFGIISINASKCTLIRGWSSLSYLARRGLTSEQDVYLDVLPCHLVPAQGASTNRWDTICCCVYDVSMGAVQTTSGWNSGERFSQYLNSWPASWII